MEELPTGAVYGCLLMPAKIQKVECLVLQGSNCLKLQKFKLENGSNSS